MLRTRLRSLMELRLRDRRLGLGKRLSSFQGNGIADIGSGSCSIPASSRLVLVEFKSYCYYSVVRVPDMAVI